MDILLLFYVVHNLDKFLKDKKVIRINKQNRAKYKKLYFFLLHVLEQQQNFKENLITKVYKDKVAPSELWAPSILMMSCGNFYLVGLCTESDFTPNNFWTSVAIFTKFSECFLIIKR